MAYPQRLARLVFAGSLWRDEEIWTISMHLRPTEPGADLPAPYAAWPAAAAWFTGVGARISNAARMHYVKLNEINEQGLYARENESFRHDHPVVGGVRGPIQGTAWPAVTYAVTLRTTNYRGPASRGRFYVPAPAPSQDAETGRIPTTDCNEMATAAATFIGRLNVDLAPWKVVVASNAHSTMADVTGVEVGDVMDTQRRRRNSMPEARVAWPLISNQGTAQPV